jgi:hypothetical protein
MKITIIKTFFSRHFLTLLSIFIIASCTSPYERQCIKYEENEDTTCTPAHDLLANKTWTFDSAFLNGHNISADCFLKGDTVKFVISDINISTYSWIVVNAASLETNDSNFAFVSVCSTDAENRPMVDSLFKLASNDGRLYPYTGRPLIFGLMDPNGELGSKTIIRKLTNKSLKLQSKNTSGDTNLINYFSIH